MSARIQLDREFIADFCRRHHVHRLSLFGSVLTDRFRPKSDVDVLIEFEPEDTPGFFDDEGKLGSHLENQLPE